jgi:hypothetical protein
MDYQPLADGDEENQTSQVKPIRQASRTSETSQARSASSTSAPAAQVNHGLSATCKTATVGAIATVIFLGVVASTLHAYKVI